MHDPRHVETAVLVEGLRASYARFLTSEADTRQAFHAAFEMLAWSGALHDRFRDEKRAIQPVLNGLWYARNIVLHSGADVLDWEIVDRPYGDGAYGAGGYGAGVLTHWTWRSRSEMPEPESKRGAVDYDAKVAGRSVAEVFQDLIDAVI